MLCLFFLSFILKFILFSDYYFLSDNGFPNKKNYIPNNKKNTHFLYTGNANFKTYIPNKKNNENVDRTVYIFNTDTYVHLY